MGLVGKEAGSGGATHCPTEPPLPDSPTCPEQPDFPRTHLPTFLRADLNTSTEGHLLTAEWMSGEGFYLTGTPHRGIGIELLIGQSAHAESGDHPAPLSQYSDGKRRL